MRLGSIITHARVEESIEHVHDQVKTMMKIAITLSSHDKRIVAV